MSWIGNFSGTSSAELMIVSSKNRHKSHVLEHSVRFLKLGWLSIVSLMINLSRVIRWWSSHRSGIFCRRASLLSWHISILDFVLLTLTWYEISFIGLVYVILKWLFILLATDAFWSSWSDPCPVDPCSISNDYHEASASMTTVSVALFLCCPAPSIYILNWLASRPAFEAGTAVWHVEAHQLDKSIPQNMMTKSKVWTKRVLTLLNLLTNEEFSL
jgi:hypothetical protein